MAYRSLECARKTMCTFQCKEHMARGTCDHKYCASNAPIIISLGLDLRTKNEKETFDGWKQLQQLVHQMVDHNVHAISCTGS